MRLICHRIIHLLFQGRKNKVQAVLGEIVLVAYLFITAYLRPYGTVEDNLLSCTSMISALLLAASIVTLITLELNWIKMEVLAATNRLFR